jgi:hypothetical protein
MSTHRLMTIAGSEKECRAFLAGVAAAHGLPWGVWFCEEHGVEGESPVHEVLEHLHLERRETRVIVGPELASHAARAFGVLPEEAGLHLRLIADQLLREAILPYRFRVFSREVAGTVRRLLGELPAGVRREGAHEKERVEPDAAGIEAYAPEPEYVLAGSGSLIGGWSEILATRERLTPVGLIKLEPIRLTLEVPSGAKERDRG